MLGPAVDPLVAQLVLLLAGLLVCFRGYSTLKLAVAATTFVVAAHAVLARAELLPKEPAWLPLAIAAGAGLLAALLVFAAYRLGVVVLGAGACVFVALAFQDYLPADRTIRLGILAGVALLGALLARLLERVLLSAATAAYGGFMVASVVLAAAGQAKPGVFLPHSLSQIPRAPLFLAVWGILAVLGTSVQLKGRPKG